MSSNFLTPLKKGRFGPLVKNSLTDKPFKYKGVFMKLMFYCCFVAVMLWVSKTTYTSDGNYRSLSSVGNTSYTKLTGSDFAKY